ncbi:MAG TPA: hypothetical protein VMM58_08130 [Bacteroidota bacterium]|nr:hypothetical protein [Bacteroidota bacterium]
MTCSRCAAKNSKSVLFCSVCGHALQANVDVECESHPGVGATGICTVCGRPVCDDCSLSREGKLYCEDARHSQLTRSHALLAYTSTEFDADIVAKNLALNGVSVHSYSAGRYSQFYQWIDRASVSLFVERQQLEEARRLIAESDLGEFLISK